MNRRFTKLVLIPVISIFLLTKCEAQYTTAFGGRITKSSFGVDVKHFFDATKTTAFELFAGLSQEANTGYLGKIFFLKQLPIHNSRLQVPTKIIFGVGTHTGYYRDPYWTVKDGEVQYYPMNTISIGIDGMLGVEYSSRRMPFTVGVDVTPYYSFLNPGTEWIDFGLNVRYKIR